MDINEEIVPILKQFGINKDEGLLYLLGVYYKLDVEKVCSEETIKAMALTKIVDKDYAKSSIHWNIPLFKGQQTEWDWVTKYNDMWNVNRERKDGNQAVLARMQEFFKKYPHIRKEDVHKATTAYFKTVRDTQYLKSSAKFIFEGSGATKMSHLLGWVEKTKEASSSSNMKGTIVT